jgi:hypothetical protein
LSPARNSSPKATASEDGLMFELVIAVVPSSVPSVEISSLPAELLPQYSPLK